MYSFRNDYSEGAHEQILDALLQTNRLQTAGYGEDEYCEEAKELIRQEIGNPAAEIFFLSGGTQTNMTAISALLKPYEAVISADTGHINVHETGAVEATGHKVLTCLTQDGKLTPELAESVLAMHQDHHMVRPAMVYISNTTEVGTIYSRDELIRLSEFCKANQLYLFMDGARLGSALTSPQNDLTMKDIAAYTDCFYIGGTKNGALLGEAYVINKPELAEGFIYSVKQKGGLLAKGRILGIQFKTLFEDRLFYELAAHANKMAVLLKEGISELGYSFFTDSPSNQQFPIFHDEIVEKLKAEYTFEIQYKPDQTHTCIRLVTSWATPQEAVEQFLADLAEIGA